MSAFTVTRSSVVPAAPEEVWQWHLRPGAFERLVPPWEEVTILERDPRGIAEGARVTLELRHGPATLHWVAEHRDVRAPYGFDDVQVRGPFGAWHHARRFEAAEGGTRVTDTIRAEPPLGALGGLLSGTIEDDLARMLAWRHRVLADDLARLMREPLAPMRIAITGATGMIGTALAPMLTTAGHEVLPISRRDQPGGITWDPSRGQLDPARLEGIDAVIHLAGAPLAEGRWTAERKRELEESRTEPTALLARTLAGLARKPRVLVSVSAIGIYGDRADAVLDEDAATADDFLGRLATAWEAAARPAADAGIRVVHPRLGVVLTPRGGALAKLLTPFKLGAGGVLGSGEQWMSWVAIDDVLAACWRALADPGLAGLVNVVAPAPVTNREFTRVLAGVLGRPAIVPVPAFALETIFGEMATATILASQRVRPRRLEDRGHRFLFPALEQALRHVLGRAGDTA